MQYFFDYLKKNFVYFLAGFTIIFALVTILYTQIQETKVEPTPKPIQSFSPSPTSTPRETPTKEVEKPQSDKPYQLVTDEDEKQLKIDAAILQLIKKLPYPGTNFSLSYDYSTDVFTLSLKAGNENDGNAEFDSFLISNQIESRNYLKNLIVRSE